VHSDETEMDLKRAKIDEQLATWIDALIQQKKLCVQGWYLPVDTYT
jgi:hypothetical protein